MKIKDLLIYGKEKLKNSYIEDYDLISKLLIEYVCKINRNNVIVHIDEDLDEEKSNQYIDAIDKVASGLPVQYITNNQEFMGLNFYVDENVLIPQPDTEIVVQEVIDSYKDKSCKIMDLCTGSGAIGISIAKYIDNINVTATDISMKAIQVAKLNAEKNLVHKKMCFIESDLFQGINEYDFDAIVSNPPYIETKVIDNLSEQVKNEPYIALDGGQDGLDFYRKIVNEAWKYIKNDGKLFLEIGYDQKVAVTDLLEQNDKYCNIYSKKDFGGNDRIVVATVRR